LILDVPVEAGTADEAVEVEVAVVGLTRLVGLLSVVVVTLVGVPAVVRGG